MKCKKHDLSYTYVCPECLKPYLKGSIFLNLEEIRQYQKSNSLKVKTIDAKKTINIICALKIKYIENIAFAGSLLYDINHQSVTNCKIMKFHQPFPYFSTVLFLRDLEIYLKLAQELIDEPDCYILNASGQLHPFFFGTASNFGIKLKSEVPVIGITKKPLIKDIQVKNLKKIDDGKIIGDVILIDKTIGKYLTSEDSKKGTYISVGNNISLDSALKIVLKIHKFRVPEPVRLLGIELKKFIGDIR